MHRFFLGLSRLMAILGGTVLSILIVMICVSIIGRSINTIVHIDALEQNVGWLTDFVRGLGVGPVNGDFELVEAGIAFSIFSFLPMAQMSNAHASVDIFTSWLPRGANRVLGAAIEVLFAVALVIIAVQLYDGMSSKMRSGTTTFLLQFPVWWSYALSLVGAATAAIVGVYMAGVRVAEAITGRTIVVDEMGADH
ncbi:MAG TPA: TRAP transporter small permease [Paracoccaceae bacterium]|nr:TRAP transporter small permease [Paracoccaceae bacterium]